MKQPPINQSGDTFSANAGSASKATANPEWQAPSPSEYEAFLEALIRVNRFEFQDPLERAYETLRTVANYIDSDLYISREGFTSPLHSLINSLSDTLRGGQPAMLRPRRRAKGPPKDQSFASVQGILSGALDVLIRTGMPRDSAARFVATQAESLKVSDRNGQRLTAKEIIARRARAGDDLPATGSAAFKKLASLTLADQKSAKSHVRDALEALSNRGHGRDRNSG
jgi:hypothetical protein